MIPDLPLDPCPVEATVGVIGGKWKPLLLFCLLKGTKRFGDPRRNTPQVTPQMLTTHLRELERDGVIHRHVYAQIPPKVEYSLTEFGHSLEPILLLMVDWGQRYFEQAATEEEHRQKEQSTLL